MAYSPSLCKTFNHYRCHVALNIWLIISPFLLVIGTVGNILSICVLVRKRMRKHPASVYLVGLACADLGVLYIGLLREWLVHLTETDYRKNNDVTCRLQLWLQFSTFTSSVWILTAFTIDRHISVTWPLFSRVHCSKNLQLTAVITIPLVAMLIGAHYCLMEQQITYKWSNVTNTSEIYIIRCEPRAGPYFKFYYKIWPLITVCMCSLLPVLLIFISNVRILKVLLTRHKRVAPQPATNTTTTHSDVKRSVHRMVIALGIFYIFSTLPVCMYLLLESHLFPVNTPTNVVNRMLFWAIASLCFYSNSAFNFVLYCFSGSVFRYALKDMVTSALRFLLRKLTANNSTGSLEITQSTNLPRSSTQRGQIQQQTSVNPSTSQDKVTAWIDGDISKDNKVTEA